MIIVLHHDCVVDAYYDGSANDLKFIVIISSIEDVNWIVQLGKNLSEQKKTHCEGNVFLKVHSLQEFMSSLRRRCGPHTYLSFDV